MREEKAWTKGQWEKRKGVEFKKVLEGKEKGKPPLPDTDFQCRSEKGSGSSNTALYLSAGTMMGLDTWLENLKWKMAIIKG